MKQILPALLFTVLISSCGSNHIIVKLGAPFAAFNQNDYITKGDELMKRMTSEEASYKAIVGNAPHTAAIIGIVSGGAGGILSILNIAYTPTDTKKYISISSSIISLALTATSAIVLEGESEDESIVSDIDAAIRQWSIDKIGITDLPSAKNAYLTFVTTAANVKQKHNQLTFDMPLGLI